MKDAPENRISLAGDIALGDSFVNQHRAKRTSNFLRGGTGRVGTLLQIDLQVGGDRRVRLTIKNMPSKNLPLLIAT